MSTSERVTFSSTAGGASGHIERPTQARPGVLVIQEYWGVVPHIKDVCHRFAAQGYVALAPDLYHGKTTVVEQEAVHLMKGLDWGRAAKELAGAVRHLREAEGCTSVGIVGFCMGGALTLIAAAQEEKVDAYASFYGFPPKEAADLFQVGSRVRSPGLIFFGENENFFSVPDAQRFAEKQRDRGIDTQVVVYPAAGHAFFNDDRPEAYHQGPANDAWRRTLSLFGEHLRSA